jgi:hypothetical protein
MREKLQRLYLGQPLELLEIAQAISSQQGIFVTVVRPTGALCLASVDREFGETRENSLSLISPISL